MSERWFRVYEGLAHDPKVQRLPAEIFRGLINLWCLASGNDGLIPSIEDVAFSLRLSAAKAAALVADLCEAGLIDKDGDILKPHNWRGRQFKSDVSTERVKQFRERRTKQGNVVSGNVSPTFHETPPEQNRAETETEAEEDRSSSVGNSPPRAREASRIEREVRDAIGSKAPPENADFSPISAMIEDGYDPVKDVLAACRSAAEKATGTVGSWQFYATAISRRPKANGKPATATMWLTNEDPRWPEIAEMYQRERTKPLIAAGSSHATGIGAFVPAAWLLVPTDGKKLDGGTENIVR